VLAVLDKVESQLADLQRLNAVALTREVPMADPLRRTLQQARGRQRPGIAEDKPSLLTSDATQKAPPAEMPERWEASQDNLTRLDGSPLVYNCRDPLLPDLVICRPELASALLAALATAC
jgi:hypothetical protein